MGDGDGGVTLRIDADTAAYITKLARMGEEHAKVTQHTEGWADAIEHVVSGFGRALVPLALIDTAIESGREGLAAWNESIERAGKTADTLVNSLRRITAVTGESREAVSTQLLDVNSQLSAQERVGAYKAFRGAAPGSANRIAPGEIIRKVSQAEVAGYDPEQFARLSGNLEGVFGQNAFDAAGLFMEKTGDQADSASEMVRRIAQKAGPKGAQQLAPYLLASAQAGDKRFSIINSLVNGYNPAFGDFGEYLKQGKFRVGAGERGLYDSITAKLPGAERDLAGLPGFIGRRASSALEDENIETAEQTKFFNSNAEINEFRARGDRAETRELKAARKRFNAVDDPSDAALIPNIHEAIQHVTGNYQGDDVAKAGVGRAAAGGDLQAIRIATEQTALHLGQRALVRDAHGESAR